MSRRREPQGQVLLARRQRLHEPERGEAALHVTTAAALPSPAGPCQVADTACLGGPSEGLGCSGKDAVCGAGGLCDACPLHGGVTTEDEMFILLGSYYTVP